MVKIRFNGKTITSSYQLKRELESSIKRVMEQKIRSAAPSGVRLTRTTSGFEAKGSQDEIQRMLDRLNR